MLEHGKNLQETFINPPAKYRGMPFWAWNGDLETMDQEAQIQQFQDMGMGGFYMHTRVGLKQRYLGDTFMECIRNCVRLAGEKGLYSCLYDEDRWPSGYGGGFVTTDDRYRSRYLLITPWKKGEKYYPIGEGDSQAVSSPQGNGTFLAAYYIELDDCGNLKKYQRCEPDAPERAGAKKWYVYKEIAHDNPWFNNQAYADTLNPETVKKFLEITHENYYSEVGTDFGGQIPYIFTDEPQFARKKNLGTAWNEEDIMLPYTDDFADTYRQQFAAAFFDTVPELLWELPEEQLSIHRYRYHRHVTERFSQAYGQQIRQWCDEHGIGLTGHMMEEPTLESQTKALGEVMGSMFHFTMPGVDMLCDRREYTTVKQAQSLARQNGSPGVASELYGVTNWDFDFRSHKLQGDWQAALGVTHRVHHLTWMSMGGEAKRDYPACIGRHSPWYKKYEMLETYFARINVAMSSGEAEVRVGVIHPIESYWLLFGPNDQTNEKRKVLEQNFADITEWLLFHTIDFDFISESILPQQYADGAVGRMKYDVIVIPGCLTLRNSTLDILQELRARGIQIIFIGNIPGYADAAKSERPGGLAEGCTRVPFEETAVIDVLAPYRFLEIRYHGPKFLKKPNHKKNWDGERTDKYIYQLRRKGGKRWLFVANARKNENSDLVNGDTVMLKMDGIWEAEEYDALTGECRQRKVCWQKGKTHLIHTFYEADSLLLRLAARDTADAAIPITVDTSATVAAADTAVTAYAYKEKQQEKHNRAEKRIALSFTEIEIERLEENVLVLDLPEYRIGNGAWKGREEILRIDNCIREQYRIPLRKAALAQPWTFVGAAEAAEFSVPLQLRYDINCLAEIGPVELALEGAEQTSIFLDGKPVEKRYSDYYVDEAIKKIKLPLLKKGRHLLQLNISFSRETSLETCFLIGDFDVTVRGISAELTEKSSKGYWGSLTEQGMPFYGGNVRYEMEVFLKSGKYELQVSKFRAPLVEVCVDGRRAGTIFASPYKVFFKVETQGIHRLELISYGNRINTFGALHNCDEKEVYFDPNAWRTTEEDWAYEYQLHQMGILKAPVLKRVTESEESL